MGMANKHSIHCTSVDKTVQYNDKTGTRVTAKITKCDGWTFELDNGGVLRALPKFVID